MHRKIGSKKIIIALLIIFILIFLFGLNIFTKEYKIDIKNNKNINYNIGWIDNESSYSGSEINFNITNTKNISFSFQSQSKANQGIEIFINDSKYIISTPNINDQKLNISVDKNSINKIKIRHFCEFFYDPCNIKINNIYVDYKSNVISPKAKSKSLTILGDSISTIYGNNNYSFLLSDKLGYELHNASILGSSLIKNKNNDHLFDRLEKDIKNYKSNKIIVFIGSNDAANMASTELFLKNYSLMIKNIKDLQPNADINLVGILYRSDVNNDIIDDYNNAIKSVAQQNNVKYIDTRELLLTSDFSDGIHPSKESQIKISDFLYKNMN